MSRHRTVRFLVSLAITAAILMGGFAPLNQAMAQSPRAYLAIEVQFCERTDEPTDADDCVNVDAPDIDTAFTITNLTDNRESKLTLDSSLFTDDSSSRYSFHTASIYDADSEYEICVENLPGWTEVAVDTGNVDVDGSCATLTLDPGENPLEFTYYENPDEPEPTATEEVDPAEAVATEPTETEIAAPTETVDEPTEAVTEEPVEPETSEPTETETVAPSEAVTVQPTETEEMTGEPTETAIPEIAAPGDTQTEDSTPGPSIPEPLVTPPITSADGFYGLLSDGTTVNNFNGSNTSCPSVIYTITIWAAG